MTLRIQVQTSRFGSYSHYDPETNKLGGFRLSRSYSHPAILRFFARVAQHTTPLNPGDFIRFWDDAGTDPDGGSWGSTNPTFEGYIEEVNPGDDGLMVEYVAYDPTYRAAQETNVMSVAWSQGTVPGTRPAEGTNAYPRLLFNVMLDNDDDWAFSRAEGQNVGDMIETILDDQYHPLYWCNAAPGDGSNAGNGVAYDSTQTNALTFEPQEKLLFESESVTSAVERLLQYYPSVRMMWKPGTRKWLVTNIRNSSGVTVTLNDSTATYPVLSMRLERNLDGRYTAIKFYGPQSLVTTIASTVDGSLIAYDGPHLEFVGAVPIFGQTSFQITDSTKRRMGRILPAEVYVPVGGYQWIPVRSPTLQCSYDGGATWATILGAYFDFQNGYTYTGVPTYFYSSEGRIVSTGKQHYFPPTDYRLVYAYHGAPITTRFPTSGFSGTAFDDAGLQHEWKIYDEMLAVGYNWTGTPVTTATRLAKYATIAEILHNDRKDIVYQGGMVLDGLDYQFAWLDRKVNIDGVDQDGNDVVTGWESIGAFVTDVEYDFEDRTTQLTFSSDQLELTGVNVDALKGLLHVQALEMRAEFETSLQFRTYTTFFGNKVRELAGVTTQRTIVFENPNTGERDIGFTAEGEVLT